LVSSDNHERNVWDKVKHKDDYLEESEENVDRNIEGVFCNWNPSAVDSKNPISRKSYEQGRENQQPSIDDGAPLEECSNDGEVHGLCPFCFSSSNVSGEVTAGLRAVISAAWFESSSVL
jgi:hypothetical protein